MNADDVFRYGHLTVLRAVDGLPDADWETPGVCGVWSTKNVLAHLASYELASGDVFAMVLGEGETPTLDLMLSEGDTFNESQVDQRASWSVAETVEDYTHANERAAVLLSRIPLAQRRQPGLLPWYGAEYDLEDLLAYLSYGHKREHSAQIAVFRDRSCKT
jgi:Mycothiol maleylpyruvate isomerase N-terminal domain